MAVPREWSAGWCADETRCFISIWSEESVQRKLDDAYRNRAIYEEISKRMEENCYSRTWKQCQRKIKHLKTLFRKAKGCKNKSGRDRINCPFYEELDRVLGDRPSKHRKTIFRKAKGCKNESGRDRMNCPHYEDLDRVLGDRPSNSSCEGDVLDSETGDAMDTVSNITTMDAMEDAAVDCSAPNVTETQGDDGDHDGTYLVCKTNLNCIQMYLQ